MQNTPPIVCESHKRTLCCCQTQTNKQNTASTCTSNVHDSGRDQQQKKHRQNCAASATYTPSLPLLPPAPSSWSTCPLPSAVLLLLYSSLALYLLKNMLPFFSVSMPASMHDATSSHTMLCSSFLLRRPARALTSNLASASIWCNCWWEGQIGSAGRHNTQHSRAEEANNDWSQRHWQDVMCARCTTRLNPHTFMSSFCCCLQTPCPLTFVSSLFCHTHAHTHAYSHTFSHTLTSSVCSRPSSA